jgi:sec-independent protein translocase protein TatA
MDFFGIGFGEVLLILIVALIIWGPKRLPGIARMLGKTMHNLKKATNDLATQVTKEIDIEETERGKKGEPTSPSGSPAVRRDAKGDE